jgi:hypothetical protein
MKELLVFWAKGCWWRSCFEQRRGRNSTGIHMAYMVNGVPPQAIHIVEEEGIYEVSE